MPTDSASVELWQRLAATSDLPKELRADAAARLATLERAETIHADRHSAHLKLIADFYAAEKTAPELLHAQLASDKKPTVDAVTEKIEIARIGRDRAQTVASITARAESIAHASVTGGLWRDHRTALFDWVAQRRAIDPTATGITEHVTPDVAAVWRRLAVILYPLPSELELPTEFTRLPVVLNAADPKPFRAAIAWCWQQIAAGHYVWAQPPQARHRANRHAPADRLRITAAVFDLPTV